MASPVPVHVDLLSFTYQRQKRRTGGDSRPTLEELCRHITPEHASNWKQIGTELGVCYSDLGTIERVYPGLNEICCNEMFEVWLQKEPRATWNHIFKAVGIESWYENPDDLIRSNDATDGLLAPLLRVRANTSTGFILGTIPRHCILHTLTAIKEAMYKGNTSLLDNFVRELSELVKSEPAASSSAPAAKGPASPYGAFKKLEPVPTIPERAVRQFHNRAISTIEFVKLLESRLSGAAASHFKKLDLDMLQRICWKYYQAEKGSSLPQANWLNPSICYQLFLIFNKVLGEDYTVVIAGDKMNQLLEKVAASRKRNSSCAAFNSSILSFDFISYLSQIANCFSEYNVPENSIGAIVEDLYEEEVNGVLKRGHLVKKGGKRKNWKRRWFVLKSDAITYYDDCSENLTLKGKIILNDDADVLGTPDEKNKYFRFIVICGMTKRAFEIKAADLHTKNDWLQAIRKVLRERNPVTTKPRSKSSPSTSLKYHTSVDSDDDNPSPNGSALNESRLSSSLCNAALIFPTERAQSNSYTVCSQKHPSFDEVDEDVMEYDYPYAEDIADLVSDLNSSHEHDYQNMPTQAAKHHRVQLAKSLSCGDDFRHGQTTDALKNYTRLSSLRPAAMDNVRARSEERPLDPILDEDYIKMHPEKPQYVNTFVKSTLVKSQSYGEGQVLQSVIASSKRLRGKATNKRNYYKQLNRLTTPPDDSFYTPLAPGNDGSSCDGEVSFNGRLSSNFEDTHDANSYLKLLPPGPSERAKLAHLQSANKVTKPSGCYALDARKKSAPIKPPS